MQRTFRAAQEFLHHDALTCLPEAPLVHHLINSRSCSGSVGSNDYSFAQCKAVRFDYHRKLCFLAVTKRLAAVRKCPCFSCGDFLCAHQFFRENLGRLDTGRRFGRAKRAQFFSREQIDNARGKRIVGTYYGQIDMIFLREPNECLQITRWNRNVLANFGSASVSRRAENSIRVRRLPQFPRKSVFAAAASNDQNVHRLRNRSGTVEAAVSAATRRLPL